LKQKIDFSQIIVDKQFLELNTTEKLTMIDSHGIL
jgi:hypothetical protein